MGLDNSEESRGRAEEVEDSEWDEDNGGGGGGKPCSRGKGGGGGGGGITWGCYFWSFCCVTS